MKFIAHCLLAAGIVLITWHELGAREAWAELKLFFRDREL